MNKTVKISLALLTSSVAISSVASVATSVSSGKDDKKININGNNFINKDQK